MRLLSDAFPTGETRVFGALLKKRACAFRVDSPNSRLIKCLVIKVLRLVVDLQLERVDPQCWTEEIGSACGAQVAKRCVAGSDSNTKHRLFRYSSHTHRGVRLWNRTTIVEMVIFGVWSRFCTRKKVSIGMSRCMASRHVLADLLSESKF